MRNKMFGLILLGLSSTILTGCENVEAYKIENIKENQEKKIPTISFGEEIILDYHNGGKYGFKVNKISMTDERNSFAPFNAKDVFILNFTVENYSVNEDILITEGMDFKVFNENNEALKQYPLTSVNKCPVPLSMGGISTANLTLASESESKNLRIEIYSQNVPVANIHTSIDEIN